jgi:hypothetical protein
MFRSSSGSRTCRRRTRPSKPPDLARSRRVLRTNVNAVSIRELLRADSAARCLLTMAAHRYQKIMAGDFPVIATDGRKCKYAGKKSQVRSARPCRSMATARRLCSTGSVYTQPNRRRAAVTIGGAYPAVRRAGACGGGGWRHCRRPPQGYLGPRPQHRDEAHGERA